MYFQENHFVLNGSRVTSGVSTTLLGFRLLIGGYPDAAPPLLIISSKNQNTAFQMTMISSYSKNCLLCFNQQQATSRITIKGKNSAIK